MDGKGDAPGKKYPEEPRVSRISGQVEGCKRAYNDDKDRKMDEETAQRRLCEPKLLRLRPCSFRHRMLSAFFANYRLRVIEKRVGYYGACMSAS